MQITFPLQAYGRQDYGLAETILQNLFVEATPGGPTQDARLPRPGLTAAYTAGAGPIWGLFREAGVFGGDRFTLSGNGVYRERTFLGNAASNRGARWAASSTQIVLVTGGNAYCYNGTVLSVITLPAALPAVSDVVYVGSRFYYLQSNSDFWWFSALADATSIDGLAFAENDEQPDADVGAAVLSDEVWFFGQETVEPWYQTGNANNPLQRSQGRTYTRGCAAQQSIVKLDNTLFFLDNLRVVCRAGTIATRISTHGVEARLRQCTAIADVTAFGCSLDGHLLYVINIPGQTTFAYDVSTDSWAEWTSYGQTNFRSRSAVQADGAVYLGDAVNGTVWKFDQTIFADGTDPVERVLSCTVLSPSGVTRCNTIALQCSRGVGLESGADPQVQMRYSDDGARTWTDWDDRSLGVIGDYQQRPVWRKLGSIRSPGRTFQFRVTDAVGCVFSGMIMNDPRP